MRSIKPTRTYCPAGDAVLTDGFPAGISIENLLAQLNATNPEGNQPWSEHAMKHRCRALQLYRPPWFRTEAIQQGIAAHLAGKIPPERKQRQRTMADFKQKPPPIELTLRPSRDGGISMALLDTFRAMADYNVAWCDRETAADWGRRWAGTANSMDVINTKRREFHLPIFVISNR